MIKSALFRSATRARNFVVFLAINLFLATTQLFAGFPIGTPVAMSAGPVPIEYLIPGNLIVGFEEKAFSNVFKSAQDEAAYAHNQSFKYSDGYLAYLKQHNVAQLSQQSYLGRACSADDGLIIPSTPACTPDRALPQKSCGAGTPAEVEPYTGKTGCLSNKATQLPPAQQCIPELEQLTNTTPCPWSTQPQLPTLVDPEVEKKVGGAGTVEDMSSGEVEHTEKLSPEQEKERVKNIAIEDGIEFFISPDNPTRRHFETQETSELIRSKKSHEKLIREHQQKLADYIENQDGGDNLHQLKDTPAWVREKKIKGRIEQLKTQIGSQRLRLAAIKAILRSRGCI